MDVTRVDVIQAAGSEAEWVRHSHPHWLNFTIQASGGRDSVSPNVLCDTLTPVSPPLGTKNSSRE